MLANAGKDINLKNNLMKIRTIGFIGGGRITRIVLQAFRNKNLDFDSGLSPEEVIDLIPVKPIGDKEEEIEKILESKLLGLYEKIKA